MENVLKYSICSESLFGSIGKESFSMKAFSGGGRGSTQEGVERFDLKHWNTGKQAPAAFSTQDRGGPLPTGLYIVQYYGEHPHLGRCASLIQTLSSLLHADPWSEIGVSVTERSGFYIHGRGPKGSDGCIVPAVASELSSLLDAIESATKPIVLSVFQEGMNAERLEVANFFGNVG